MDKVIELMCSETNVGAVVGTVAGVAFGLYDYVELATLNDSKFFRYMSIAYPAAVGHTIGKQPYLCIPIALLAFAKAEKLI